MSTNEFISCGALNPNSLRGMDEAEKLYEQIRKRKTDHIHVLNNSGCSLEQAKVIKDYIFNNMHELHSGYMRFAPDLAMAQSWLRLSEVKGARIQPHDIVLLQHELYELRLMLDNKDLHQKAAHDIAESRYNYYAAAREFYKQFNIII